MKLKKNKNRNIKHIFSPKEKVININNNSSIFSSYSNNIININGSNDTPQEKNSQNENNNSKEINNNIKDINNNSDINSVKFSQREIKKFSKTSVSFFKKDLNIENKEGKII